MILRSWWLRQSPSADKICTDHQIVQQQWRRQEKFCYLFHLKLFKYVWALATITRKIIERRVHMQSDTTKEEVWIHHSPSKTFRNRSGAAGCKLEYMQQMLISLWMEDKIYHILWLFQRCQGRGYFSCTMTGHSWSKRIELPDHTWALRLNLVTHMTFLFLETVVNPCSSIEAMSLCSIWPGQDKE